MAYCTATEVKNAISFPSTGAPISDAVIEEFILDSQEEIEDIYKTHFGNVEESGTADGDFSTTTLSLSTLAMTANEYVGYVLWIYGGTNAGEYSEITANTETKITVSPAFSAATDNTSQFRIVKLGYKSETVDGSGTDTQFVVYQPLISLISLTIDDTSVTPSYVYQYSSGQLTLGTSDAEVKYFSDTYPQLIDMKYVYGIYPLPRIIKRLCVILAAMRTLVAQISGTYDDYTSMSLPGGVSGSKGEPYVNIRSALEKLQAEARGIIYGEPGTQVTGDFRTQPSYAPFSYFS